MIGAAKGDWQSGWSNFDQRRKANDTAEDGAADAVDDGPDMFAAKGITAGRQCEKLPRMRSTVGELTAPDVGILLTSKTSEAHG